MNEINNATALLVQSLCGAIILLCLDLWLRRRTVRDLSLACLYVSLLSWSATGAIELINLKWTQVTFGIKPEHIRYVFSPVSSILFTVTAFQLLRIRDVFRRPDIRIWPRIIIGVVAVVSAVAWILLLFGQNELAMFTDATASTIALIALGSALSYSFYRYGNQFLVALTGITFIIFVARQFYNATHGNPANVINPFILASTTMLIMLFIAIALAWALSDISRLKPVGGSVNVNIVAMFFDLRGSTRWAHDVTEKDFNYVRTFLDQLREWSWGQALASPLGRPQLIKFLGDGYMFVWEVTNGIAESTNAIVGLAYSLSTSYPLWAEKLGKKLALGVPDAIGVGVDFGPAIRLTFENGSYDYLGSPVNIAAKMQNLARPRGGVVIKEETWKLLDDLRDEFPKEAKVKFGNWDVALRMTEYIEFQSPE